MFAEAWRTPDREPEHRRIAEQGVGAATCGPEPARRGTSARRRWRARGSVGLRVAAAAGWGGPALAVAESAFDPGARERTAAQPRGASAPFSTRAPAVRTPREGASRADLRHPLAPIFLQTPLAGHRVGEVSGTARVGARAAALHAASGRANESTCACACAADKCVRCGAAQPPRGHTKAQGRALALQWVARAASGQLVPRSRTAPSRPVRARRRRALCVRTVVMFCACAHPRARHHAWPRARRDCLRAAWARAPCNGQTQGPHASWDSDSIRVSFCAGSSNALHIVLCCSEPDVVKMWRGSKGQENAPEVDSRMQSGSRAAGAWIMTRPRCMWDTVRTAQSAGAAPVPLSARASASALVSSGAQRSVWVRIPRAGEGGLCVHILSARVTG
jgi:hypothetical protein